jgi:diguanylate cyclase (GGDEF)-like protein
MMSDAGRSLRRVGVVVCVPVALIAGAVFLTANVQRSAVMLGARQQETSESMLNAILNQETGARGFYESHEQASLQSWDQGTSEFASSLAQLRSLVAGNSTLERSLARQAKRATVWHAVTNAEILTAQRTGRPPSHAAIQKDREQMLDFRASSTAFAAALRKASDHALSVASAVAAAIVGALAAMLVGIGLLLTRRTARRETARHRDQAQLRELLQASDSEQESRTLLIRHIQTLLPDCDPAVLSINHDNDRLEITTVGPSDPLALRAGSEQLPPRSCMAVRLGRAFDRRPGEESLLQCEICGATAGTSACEPLLVGGQIIGSVLVASTKAITDERRDRLRESVAQAAPILANQRNLTLAEMAARADSLTGLANRRAADETLKRLIAQAARNCTPLAVVPLDLDGLKQINDRHGHESGDHALALLGRIISSTIRASDFAARVGGDEFVIMLPDTDRDGAVDVAEKLRTEIQHAEVPGIGTISASLGVAVLPDDAADADDLLRKGDRALYAAKKQGRNCVGAFSRSPDQPRNQPATEAAAGSDRRRLRPTADGSDADHH